MRWVKLTLAPDVRASWLLRIWRLTSKSLAGTVRTLVAVGTLRLSTMLATMREAAPRRGNGAASSAAGRTGGGAGAEGATGTGAAGARAAVDPRPAAAPLPSLAGRGELAGGASVAGRAAGRS